MTQDTTTQLAMLLQNNYGLSNCLVEKPEDGIEGNTYIITAGKQKYVAKVYGNQQQADILANYQNALYEANVPVSAIVKTQANELATKLNGQYAVLCEFAHGSPLGWRKELSNMPNPLSRSIALALAKMHYVGQSIHAAKLGYALSAPAVLSPHNLKACRQTLIHGDLTRENIFVDPHTSALTAIIDFGDAHYDYITYDIAIALTHIYVTKSWGIDFSGIEDFLAAYTRHTSLTQHERQTILPFMIFRNTVLLREIDLQLTKDRDDHKDLESIKQSLQTKLLLLKEHSSQMKNIFD